MNSKNNDKKEFIIHPKTPAARVLIPLLDALNWQGDNNKLLEALTLDINEMDTDGLIETMANLNFRYYKIDKFSNSKIDIKVLPLLSVKGNDHKVIINVEDNEALVYDGFSGTYKQTDINSISGDIFYFKYAEEVEDSLMGPQNNWFSKLMYRLKSSMVKLGIITLLITILDLIMPLFVMLVFDQIFSVNNIKTLVFIFIGVMIYIVSFFLLSHIRSILLNYLSTRIGNVVLSQTFARLMYLSPSYTETASINSQLSRIKDFENIKGFITSENFSSLFNLLFSLMYIGTIIIIGGWIGLVPLTLLVVLVLFGIFMRPFHKIKMEKLSINSSNKQQNLFEFLKNLDEIKSIGTKDNWVERSKKIVSDYVMSNFKLSDYVSISNNISYFISSLAVIVVIYGTTIKVIEGSLSAGYLIAIIMLTWRVVGPIRSAFNVFVQMNGIVKSISQINRFMKLPQDNNLKTNMIAKKDIKGYIRFVDVSLRYNSTSNLSLASINFSINPGKILGVSGHDGAGKTSIIKLILSMYKPQGGRILLDGVNIREMEPYSLRKSISYAPEKDYILTGTLRDNILAFSPSLSDSDIRSSMERLELDKYSHLFDNGLDTMLTEKFISELPGDVKKLMNLVRMITRKSKIYLIDEPENHLNDFQIETTTKVLYELARIDKATVIICSRELRMLDICDKVVYLNEGRVFEKPKVEAGIV